MGNVKINQTLVVVMKDGRERYVINQFASMCIINKLFHDSFNQSTNWSFGIFDFFLSLAQSLHQEVSYYVSYNHYNPLWLAQELEIMLKNLKDLHFDKGQ